MQKTTFIKSIFIIIFCIVPQNSKPRNITVPEIALTGLGAIATGACLYGIYQWWMYEEPLEELIFTTKSLIQSSKEHATIIALFNQNDFIDEKVISFCAQQLYPHNQFWSPHAILSNLHYQESKLHKRYTKLLQKPETLLPSTVDQLEQLLYELKILMQQFEGICKHWHTASIYISLYFQFKTYSVRYSNDIQHILYANDQWHLEQALQYATTGITGSFKLTQYVKHLERDINSLKQTLHAMHYNFPILHNDVQQLLYATEQLYAKITGTTAYIQDLQAYKTYELEQERLRLERERLALARQQAQAQAALAHAYEQKMWHDMWYKPEQKETIVVVTPPQQQQQPVTINNNINNPVCNQTVSPVVEQKPSIKQKTSENQKPKESSSSWSEDLQYWLSKGNEF